MLSDVPRIRHGFTTRSGGVSSPPYDSLNLGLHVGDVPSAVSDNRSRACGALGFSLDDWVSGEQVHGASVLRVTGELRGRGARAHNTSLPGVDGLVTDTPGVLLAGYFADCVPILIADPQGPKVGIAHAGWRGTLAGIARNLVRTLEESFGSPPERLVAWVGPAIGACCFHVGLDVAELFARAGFGDFISDGPSIDLKGINRELLVAAGLDPAHVEASNLCTACSTERFFSHRALGPRTGRMAGLIGIESGTGQDSKRGK